MNPQELVAALLELDKLLPQMDSFKNWLDGNRQPHQDYEATRKRIEDAFPGCKVVQADLTYRKAHVLAPND